MKKILRIARTEYSNAIRSKAFVIGILMLPVMMFGGIGLQLAVKDKVDVRDRRFAVVDASGRLFSAIQQAAEARNENEIFETDDGRSRKVRPAFIPVEYEPDPDASRRVDLELSEKVRSGELFAFVIIERHAIDPQADRDAEIRYYTETPTFTQLPDWLDRTLNAEILERRYEEANLDEALISRLSRQRPIERLGLVRVKEGDQVVEAKRDNPLATFGVPFVSMFLLFAIVMTSAPALLNTVLEEKIQRIAEVLLSSASPFQLMLGKLLGAVGVSLTLAALYLSAAFGLLRRFAVSELVPATHFLWFILFLLLALLIFGSMFSAIGAACSELRDAQTMMFPAMLLVLIPLFVWMPVVQSPTSPFARAISLIPPLTPMLMMLRISIPPGPPWWEIALGVSLTFLFMLACVWASGKIFRIGILSHGQTPSIARLARWIFSR